MVVLLRYPRTLSCANRNPQNNCVWRDLDRFLSSFMDPSDCFRSFLFFTCIRGFSFKNSSFRFCTHRFWLAHLALAADNETHTRTHARTHARTDAIQPNPTQPNPTQPNPRRVGKLSYGDTTSADISVSTQRRRHEKRKTHKVHGRERAHREDARGEAGRPAQRLRAQKRTPTTTAIVTAAAAGGAEAGGRGNGIDRAQDGRAQEKSGRRNGDRSCLARLHGTRVSRRRY